MSETSVIPTFLSDWQAAEAAAVDHMKTLGFIDAHPTAPGPDGGIDALASGAAAQVKFYASPVGRPDIQRLRGAAREYRIALFYSTGGYSKEAVAYANDAQVALFLMDPYGRCEPQSSYAVLLLEPATVLERKSRLEELQASRYCFAASALGSDLDFFVEFAHAVTLTPEVLGLYSYVVSDLQSRIPDFRIAVESKQFGQADILFGEIQNRTSFLRWTTSAEPTVYADIEAAIAEGWRRDTTPGSQYLIQKAVIGVTELKDFLIAALEGWSQHLPDEVPADQLISFDTIHFAGMLEIAALDTSVLSPELLQHLTTSVRAGVDNGIRAANQAFAHILDLHEELKLTPPSSIFAKKLRAESIAARVLRQLDMSLSDLSL